ncbi:hypothetical protein WBG78_01670 [Chryseolinea sp. T2]|uniref:hypothetical protein n=1 Tax=Chryseolinea sp. T2 TaxID=3129255 RepID=UPI003077CAE1
MTVRIIGLILAVISCTLANAQFVTEETQWVDQLELTGGLPEKLLSTRTAVFYDYALSAKELNDLQDYFQRTGIDAVVYFELDMLVGGKDVTRAFADYLVKREVANLFFVEKNDADYRITCTLFNGKESVVDKSQKAWSIRNPIFLELVKNVYRQASSLQRNNLLINPEPETGLSVNPISGKRNEFYAIDAKVDPLAVPMTGDPAVDAELEKIFAENYSLKYKLTPAGTSEKDLRKQGLLYVICVVRTRNAVAKELLGYETKGTETEFTSTSFPDALPQAKNIPANTTVYKFYFKHIDSQNTFLGTKWDADETWQQALLNQLRGMKAELRLN